MVSAAYRKYSSPEFLAPLRANNEGVKVRGEYQYDLWHCSFYLWSFKCYFTYIYYITHYEGHETQQIHD